MFYISSIVLVFTVLTSAGIEGAGDSRRQLVIISLYFFKSYSFFKRTLICRVFRHVLESLCEVNSC